MSKVRVLAAALAAITIVGCEAADPLSPKTINPATVRLQAVDGDVVHLQLVGPAPVGTLVLIKNYTPRAEPFTCSEASGTTHTFVGEITAVLPGYSTGHTSRSASGILEGVSASIALAPNTVLRITGTGAFCGGWVQTAIVQ